MHTDRRRLQRPARAASIGLLALLLPLSCLDAQAETSLRLVAYQGDPVPSAGPLAQFAAFSLPQLDALGRATFRATLQGTLASGASPGIWSERGAGLVELARVGLGAPAPATGGYTSLDLVVADAAGDVWYRAGLDSFIYDVGIFVAGDAPAEVLGLEETHAEGTPAGVVFASFDQLVSNGGSAAAVVRLGGPGVGAANDGAVYTWPGGALVMREGSTAPGVLAPFGPIRDLAINAAGEVAIDAEFGSPATGTGIWAQGEGGDLQAVAFSGQPAPGLEGVTFDDITLGSSEWNAARQVAFESTLAGAGVHAGNLDAIWSGEAGALAMVARAGDTAPGTGAGFGGFHAPQIDEAGGVAFIASLVTGNPSTDSGIWSDRGGALALLVREGAAAPGASGAVFDTFSDLSTNGAGEVAIAATLRGVGVTAGNDTGLWREVEGALELVIREGEPIVVAPGVERTLVATSRWEGSGHTSGWRSSFNDIGTLAFHASFEDGSSGLIVAPEPDGIALGLAAVVALARRSARHRSR